MCDACASRCRECVHSVPRYVVVHFMIVFFFPISNGDEATKNELHAIKTSEIRTNETKSYLRIDEEGDGGASIIDPSSWPQLRDP